MPRKSKALTVLEPVEPLIREIRGERVMLDADLARIYRVPTFRLNEAVKRNQARFPKDFRFQLTPDEFANLISQSAISSSGHGGRRKLAWAFTEHGAIMAANVLSRNIVAPVNTSSNFGDMRAYLKLVTRLLSAVAVALGWLALSQLPARADGCFVFKSGNGMDVSEPTQRALIVHDAGREDLLLLVRYEGPRQEFGWLIPVPGRPRVSKGSTEAFRELSRLTPSSSRLQSMMGSQRDEREEIEVIEDRTIGEYRVATLSAHSSGGLERWLRRQRFSLPKHASGIIDEYIRTGWYFVAVKIRLSSGALKSPKDRGGIEQPASLGKHKRASGELTPLLISFGTAECVFPLKVSSIGGKASEVLVYVLSAEPMLSAVMFRKGMEGLRLERAALTKEALERRGFTATTTAHDSLDNGYFGSSKRLFRSATISADQAPASAKLIPRIKGKRWQLTKQVWTFEASEMEDLIFTPASPALAQMLKLPEGGVAADALVSGGGAGARAVLSAMRSTNSLERANASSMLMRLRGPDVAKVISELLKDEIAQVRLNAVMGAAASGLPKLAELLEPLRRDPHPRIRWHVAQILGPSARSGQ